MAGGLTLAWKDSINVQIINSRKFFVAAEVKEFRNNGVWTFIGVHLSCSKQIQALQFEELTTMSQQLERKSVDIGMVGRPFTWTNRRQGKDLVKERLDRYLVGMGWKLKFPNAVVHRLTKSGSDHAPILMETKPQSWHSKRCFKYQEHWSREDDVKRIVGEVWKIEVVGSAMFSVAQKLKECRHRLVQWQITHKANFRKEIEDLQASLEELRVAGINGGEEITRLEEKLELAYMKEESYWREKSRIKWQKEGYQNTRFFHQKFQSRVRRNRIWRLVGRNNEIASKPEDIAKVAEDYFCDIFTSSCSVDPNPYLEDLEPKVTASMNCRLQRLVTIDEVKRATFSVHAKSAPGDDGFIAKFFHFFWDIVGGDVFKTVQSFFHSGRIIKNFNHTQICLIPKVLDASDMTQRSGADHEMAIKLDMSKAYDRVEWHFLWYIMEKLGFDAKWINWTKKLVMTVS
ncbi:uncharacterized protein LOC130975298 [Arachis stenosperma]|uniref:uncharacterized protein LOC130975298 n=1 Tax=Arachis stenosperma TaxID=217475 RepID=UPI0025ACF422|nr:uncharacterized protein LOC130975298 [Arachis stenosperma]